MFYGQNKFTLIPDIKGQRANWFQKFQNISNPVRTYDSGTQNRVQYQVYLIKKDVLKSIKAQTSFCKNLVEGQFCRIPLFFKLIKKGNSYVKDGYFRKIISIKLVKYSDKKILPFNSFIQ